ncbi:glycosyl transferase [Cytophagales bacterium WSM2-2]|nr:glycosyl transferase [Cytophagales bacterium WSM2-2]
MAFYFIFVFSFYFLSLLLLTVSWVKQVRKPLAQTSKNIFISVIIPFRNEADNLVNLLRSILQLKYPVSDFEVIVVDDHSEDTSMKVLEKVRETFSTLKIEKLDDSQQGKKAALTLGINIASGEIIATTDADCLVPCDWLQCINAGFQNENTNMLIGAVSLKDRGTFFNRLQNIEWASVIGTGVAMCGLRNPLMCNGANLSFRKKVFEEVKGYSGNEHILSGDDEFLMRKIHNLKPESIQVLSVLSPVVTEPQRSLGGFIQQRLRWASKWKVNSSGVARSFALAVLLLQGSWLCFAGWGILNLPLQVIVLVFGMKVFGELMFLVTVSRSLRMRFGLIPFLALQFLYPVYVLFTGLFSQIKDHEWKGRKS